MINKKICIGTAQFGSSYGITNSKGRVDFEEIKKILELIKNNNIHLIDTAQNYGDTEKIIGKIIGKHDNFFEIITKISPYFSNQLSKKEQFDKWTTKFEESLIRLNKTIIEGVLIHSIKSNLDQKLTLMDWLLDLKNRGMVKKIGWSIYEESDLASINLDYIDIVQIPFSIYDQRLMKNGFLKNLNQKGIEVHARSIFLQGLILTNYLNWPKWIDHEDYELHKSLQEEIYSTGSTPIEIAIGFVKECPYIDALIFGFTSIKELIEIIKVFNDPSKLISNKKFSNVNFSKKLLDPRSW